jgi:shikimate dehydrogenase
LQLYGIIGYPLVQSFSQPYFRNKFVVENIVETDYLTFPIHSIDLFPQILIDHPTLKGLNVTMPYKETVLSYIHKITAAVAACGATNCLKIQDGTITAYNTDVIGFEQSLRPLLQAHHTKALVLGTGGAAKAVAYVLKKIGVEFLYVSRGVSTHTLNYNDISKDIIAAYTVIINASPSGMLPNAGTFPPLPYTAITPQHLLYDLVYKPAETIFLQKGKEQGAIVKNGFEMLELQAEAAWAIWHKEDSLTTDDGG